MLLHIELALDVPIIGLQQINLKISTPVNIQTSNNFTEGREVESKSKDIINTVTFFQRIRFHITLHK